MVAQNLPRSLALVFGHEGGFDNDRRDRGNWTSGQIGVGRLKGTKFGIASHVYPNLDIKNITQADAAAIYARDYAPKVAYGQQPAGVDHTVLDISINAGAGRATQLQARALGVPAGTAPVAMAAAAQRLRDKVAHIKNINARMLSFYQSLSKFSVYGRGWTRRNAEREATSIKWALEAEKLSPAQVNDRLKGEAKEASGKEKTSATVSTTSAGGGTATTAGGAAEPSWMDAMTTIDWIALGLIAAAILAVAVYFGQRWYVHRQRRLALSAALLSTASEGDDDGTAAGFARNDAAQNRRANPRRRVKRPANRKSRR